MINEMEPAEAVDYVLIDALANVYLSTKPKVEAGVTENGNTADAVIQELFTGSLTQIIAHLSEVQFQESHFSTKTKEAVALIRKAIADNEIIVEPYESTTLH